MHIGHCKLQIGQFSNLDQYVIFNFQLTIFKIPSAQSSAAPGKGGNRRGAGVWNARLPRKVGKGLVGLGHAMHVLTLGHGIPFAMISGQQFAGQFLLHGLALFLAAGL
jgi:hypothetical protein